MPGVRAMRQPTDDLGAAEHYLGADVTAVLDAVSVRPRAAIPSEPLAPASARSLDRRVAQQVLIAEETDAPVGRG